MWLVAPPKLHLPLFLLKRKSLVCCPYLFPNTIYMHTHVLWICAQMFVSAEHMSCIQTSCIHAVQRTSKTESCLRRSSQNWRLGENNRRDLQGKLHFGYKHLKYLVSALTRAVLGTNCLLPHKLGLEDTLYIVLSLLSLSLSLSLSDSIPGIFLGRGLTWISDHCTVFPLPEFT